jgi:hypothetical protein
MHNVPLDLRAADDQFEASDRLKKQNLFTQIDNRMNALTERGRAASPSRSTELSRGDKQISHDCGVDDPSGGQT